MFPLLILFALLGTQVIAMDCPPPGALFWGNNDKDFDIQYDDIRRTLRIDGDTIKLTLKPYLLFKALAQSPGRVFSRDDLRIATDTTGEENRNMDRRIGVLRKALGPYRVLIETAFTVGYRFYESLENRIARWAAAYEAKAPNLTAIGNFVLDEYSLRIYHKGKSLLMEYHLYRVLRLFLKNPRVGHFHHEIEETCKLGHEGGSSCAVSSIREMLGDDAQLIVTVPRKGYYLDLPKAE